MKKRHEVPIESVRILTERMNILDDEKCAGAAVFERGDGKPKRSGRKMSTNSQE